MIIASTPRSFTRIFHQQGRPTFSVYGVLWIVTSLANVVANPLTCNGLSNLCSVKVTDTYFAMVHNAMSAVENGFIFAANHMDDPLIEALDAGYRGLNLDICNCGGELQLCHGNDITGCGVGRVDPLQAFTDINNWISANPNNVIMISLQINEDAGDAMSLAMIQELLQQVPDGFSDRLYDHWPITSDWPTVGELIEANKQVLFFYFQGPDGTGDHVPGLNYWYNSVIATDSQWESVSQIESSLLVDCPMTRGLSSTKDFVIIEAFVTMKTIFGLQFLPSREAAQVINTAEWAGAVLDACSDSLGFPVTIFSVDFWSEGNLPSLMALRNSVLVGSSSLAAAVAPSDPPITSPPSPFPFNESGDVTTLAPSGRPLRTPTLRPSLSPNPLPIESFCIFYAADGDEIVISEGASFGTYATTSCGDPDVFPCFCRNGLMQCPYCLFTAQNGQTHCAQQNETVSFDDGPGYLTCECKIPLYPEENARGTCQDVSTPGVGLDSSTVAAVEEQSFPSSAPTWNVFKIFLGAVLAAL
jgi:hypothetical protein